MIRAYMLWARDQILILLLLAAFVFGCVVPSLWWIQFLAGKGAFISYAGTFGGAVYAWIFWCCWIDLLRKIRARTY